MLKFRSRYFLATLVLLIPTTSSYAAEVGHDDPLAVYPRSVDGLKRNVITLPKQRHEQDLQVELVIGKVMSVDCNRTSLIGTLTSKTVSGWGYDYYQVGVNPGVISTKMACVNSSVHQQLVTLSLPDDQRFITYNSRLPIVIFAPEDVKVSYRLWHAEAGTSPAKIE